MDELVERVREALAAEYSGTADGRVRDVPDRRAIRWYTTIGLVDRPLGMRGRNALYGPRHLRQLVAIKRRQAQGASLTQIQGEFTWLSDDALAEIADVPERLLEDGGAPPDQGEARHMHFWSQMPVRSAPPPAELPMMSRAAPSGADTTADTNAAGGSTPDGGVPAPAPASPGPGAEGASLAPGEALSGLALGGGAILLVPARQALSDRDRADLLAAAAPLLDLLEARGLIDRRFA